MIDLVPASRKLLAEAGCAVSDIPGDRTALTFEGATVLGFLLTYSDASALIARWRDDVGSVVSAHQFGLRRAQSKAWNTYVILLAGGLPSYAEQVALSAVEEDLSGARKIARSGISDVDGLRSALLPLLPIQKCPRLGSVDMKAEIRLRTTELPLRAVDAFLSRVPLAVLAQALEELP